MYKHGRVGGEEGLLGVSAGTGLAMREQLAFEGKTEMRREPWPGQWMKQQKGRKDGGGEFDQLQ